ncbi:MAG: hypothetical protein ACFFBK_07155 [Promethearchaeota archaeon]
MDPINLIKVIAAIITSVIAFIIGFRVLILNPGNWLNRWFTLFFISLSLGFLIYTIYHLITNNADIIIPLMVTAHIFFNFAVVSLVMTIFVLEKFTKVAMSLQYFGTMMLIFFIMSFGYFIWVPKLDMESYEKDIVNTTTPLGWFVFVNFFRIVMSIYVICKYIMMTRKVEVETRRRVQWFSMGVFIVVVGLLINLSAGFFPLIEIPIEIIALIAIVLGSIAIFKGFLI